MIGITMGKGRELGTAVLPSSGQESTVKLQQISSKLTISQHGVSSRDAQIGLTKVKAPPCTVFLLPIDFTKLLYLWASWCSGAGRTFTSCEPDMCASGLVKQVLTPRLDKARLG